MKEGHGDVQCGQREQTPTVAGHQRDGARGAIDGGNR
jgi:hypothetical protein